MKGALSVSFAAARRYASALFGVALLSVPACYCTTLEVPKPGIISHRSVVVVDASGVRYGVSDESTGGPLALLTAMSLEDKGCQASNVIDNRFGALCRKGSTFAGPDAELEEQNIRWYCSDEWTLRVALEPCPPVAGQFRVVQVVLRNHSGLR